MRILFELFAWIVTAQLICTLVNQQLQRFLPMDNNSNNNAPVVAILLAAFVASVATFSLTQYLQISGELKEIKIQFGAYKEAIKDSR